MCMYVPHVPEVFDFFLKIDTTNKIKKGHSFGVKNVHQVH